MTPRPRSFFVRLASAGAGLALFAATACGGGGDGGDGGNGGGDGDGGGGPTSTVTTPGVQHEFHPEFLESLRLSFDQLVPDRFTVEERSVQVVDVTRGEVEFKTQRDLGELARQHGLLGFGVADFTASGGFEYWGIVTWVFQTADGSRAVFERFPDPEKVTISDADKVDATGEAYGGGHLGNLSVETYASPDGITTLFLRGSLVDGNAVHYVSSVIDVPAGQSFDGLAEIRRVMKGLEGLYPAIFRKFLELGGKDESTTTTTQDPTFVPG